MAIQLLLTGDAIALAMVFNVKIVLTDYIFLTIDFIMNSTVLMLICSIASFNMTNNEAMFFGYLVYTFENLYTSGVIPFFNEVSELGIENHKKHIMPFSTI